MMKRGILRIVAGIIMIVLQILSIIGLGSAPLISDYGLWHVLGYYCMGIVGAILLVFGVLAYRSGQRSQLILHVNNHIIYTIIKWISTGICVYLFVYDFVRIINNQIYLNTYTTLYDFGLLTYIFYSLLYMYKKPTCLFSGTLIFIGAAYVYCFVSNFSYYIYLLSLPYNKINFYFVYMEALPKLLGGILYIVVATMFYKEIYSVKLVKLLGWTLIVLEIVNRVVFLLLLKAEFYDLFTYSVNLLFVLILLMYICVFNINTLPKKSKFDNINLPRSNVAAYGTEGSSSSPVEAVLFCRKCGNKLIGNSKFCRRCGTEVVEV